MNKNILSTVLLVFFAYQVSGQTVVNSLSELKSYITEDDVNIKMTPGTYYFNTDNCGSGKLFSLPTLILITSSNSTYDFTDVKFEYDTDIFTAFGSVEVIEFQVVGNDNVMLNLTMEDIGDTAPTRTALCMSLDGERNRIEGFTATTRGSYPYGYGDIFGKGGGSVISHRKHGGCQFRGIDNHLKNCNFYLKSYGHGIFIQGATNALVEGCYVEGELRTTDEVLAEKGTGSPADNVDFITVWGYTLQPGWTFSLQEDGIRCYTTGVVYGTSIDNMPTTNTSVIDCTVKQMRSGVTIGWDSGTKYVENCTAIANEVGFWVGSNTNVVNSRGDVSVGPLFGEDAARSGSTVELTIIDNVREKYGNTPSFYLAGSDHSFVIRDGTTSFDSDIQILVGGTRLGHRWLAGSGEEPPYTDATNTVIHNLTEYPVVLGANSSGTTGQSCGTISDEGTNNAVDAVVDCASACIHEVGVKLPVRATSGVNYELYEGSFDEIPDFDLLETISTGLVPSMDVTTTDSLSGFAIIFDGQINVTEKGKYTFYVSSDDPASLAINGQELVSYDGQSGLTEHSAEICLEAGYHSIEVIRLENNNDQTFVVSYEREGLTKTTDFDIFGIDYSAISNLAYLANATQSSTANDGIALRAVDGDSNGAWSGSSVTHTSGNDETSWWQVEMDDNYHIGEINVFNRTDCCADRLAQFTVSVLDEHGSLKFSQVIDPISEPSISIDAEGVLGRVVRIEKIETGVLSLAEVEVYEGTIQASGGTFQLVKSSTVLYGIDGGSFDAEAGYSLKLQETSNHENRTWTEIDRGEGYLSYQKYNTELCLDGGESEEGGSDLTMEACDENLASQQWLKIPAGEGYYRFQRRGSQLVIGTGERWFNGVNVYLDTLDVINENLQWKFDEADLNNLEVDEEEVFMSIPDNIEEILVYPNPIFNSLTLKIPESTYNQFAIYNIDGKIVRIEIIANDEKELSLDFSSLNKGGYVLMLSGNQKYKALKLVKK